MIVLQFIFEEKYAGLANPDAKNAVQKKIHVPKYDKVAVGACHLSRFVQILVFVVSFKLFKGLLTFTLSAQF